MYEYYLIICKNMLPPANKFIIQSYEMFSEIPNKYRKIIPSSDSWNMNKIYKVGKELVFICTEKDPVAAMINFWCEYMYHMSD